MKKLIISLFFILFVLVYIDSAYANDKTYNVRSFVTGHEFRAFGDKEKYDYFWYSTSIMITKDINKYMDRSYSLGMGLIGARESSAPFIECRVLYRLKGNGFYIQIGPGLSRGFNPDDLPHLADSPLYGIISLEIGYQFDNNFRLAYTSEHLSSPFHDDCGLNTGGISLSIKF